MYDLFHQPEPTPKDLAIEASYNAAPDVWKEKAMKLLIEFATYGKEFITEDFRLWLKNEKGLIEPEETRCFGGLMRRAKKSGIIEATGKFKNMKSEKSHDCPKMVWVGMIKKNT